jgi:hypothetical protein
MNRKLTGDLTESSFLVSPWDAERRRLTDGCATKASSKSTVALGDTASPDDVDSF